MYLVNCKDPSCLKCKQALEGQISKDAQCKVLKAEEEWFSMELALAAKEKANCSETCKKLKDKVHHQINELVDILKEREHVLCNEIDLEYSSQLAKIDWDVTEKCSNKLLKKSSELEKLREKIQLNFISEFDVLKKKLQNFGFVSIEADLLLPTSGASPLAMNPGLLKINDLKEFQKLSYKVAEYSQMEKIYVKDKKDITVMNTEEKLLEVLKRGEEINDRLKLLQITMMEQMPMQLGAKEIKTECPKLAETKSKDTSEESMNEDDIEFINRNEIDYIPSELPLNPPLPSKKKCWFIKRPCFSSLKKRCTSQKDSNSESSVIVKNETHEWLTTSENSSISSGYNTENVSIDEQNPESCSNGTSNEDPSAALLASFVKYLDKSADSEWLAPKKSLEHWLSSGNNCISHVSFVDKKDVGLCENWLSEKRME